MEFFDWLSIPQTVLQFFDFDAGDEGAVAEIMRRNLWICLAVAAGLFLIGLVFGGIGLHTICKKTGRKHGWMGFLPFANTYLAGKIAGEANFFGQKMKRAGLYAMLCEIAYFAMEVFLLVMNFLLIQPEFYTLTSATAGAEGEAYYYWTLNATAVSESGMGWVYDAANYGNIVSYLVWFIMLVFFCVVYFAFFRKYFVRSPFLMVLLSVILPFRGFTIFAVRNNTPIDYNEYMRRRAEELARRTGAYGPGGYGPGYGPGPNGGYGNNGYGNNGYGNNGYGNNGAPGQGGSAPDPFDDFGEQGGSAGGSGGNSGNGGDRGNGASGGSEPPSDNPFSDF